MTPGIIIVGGDVGLTRENISLMRAQIRLVGISHSHHPHMLAILVVDEILGPGCEVLTIERAKFSIADAMAFKDEPPSRTEEPWRQNVRYYKRRRHRRGKRKK